MEEEACAAAEAGDFASAAQLFRGAVAINPSKAVLHEQLAQCLLEAGNAESALEAAQRAVEIDPQVGRLIGNK